MYYNIPVPLHSLKQGPIFIFFPKPKLIPNFKAVSDLISARGGTPKFTSHPCPAGTTHAPIYQIQPRYWSSSNVSVMNVLYTEHPPLTCPSEYSPLVFLVKGFFLRGQRTLICRADALVRQVLFDTDSCYIASWGLLSTLLKHTAFCDLPSPSACL